MLLIWSVLACNHLWVYYLLAARAKHNFTLAKSCIYLTFLFYVLHFRCCNYFTAWLYFTSEVPSCMDCPHRAYIKIPMCQKDTRNSLSGHCGIQSFWWFPAVTRPDIPSFKADIGLHKLFPLWAVQILWPLLPGGCRRLRTLRGGGGNTLKDVALLWQCRMCNLLSL